MLLGSTIQRHQDGIKGRIDLRTSSARPIWVFYPDLRLPGGGLVIQALLDRSKDGYLLRLPCPVCRGELLVDSRHKAFRVIEGQGLEVEAFGCSWGGDFGQRHCTFHGALALPAPGQMAETMDHGVVRIDAVVRV